MKEGLIHKSVEIRNMLNSLPVSGKRSRLVVNEQKAVSAMFKANEYDKSWMDEATVFEMPSKEQPVHAIEKVGFWDKLYYMSRSVNQSTYEPVKQIFLGQREKKILIESSPELYKEGDEAKLPARQELMGLELHFTEDESYFKVF